VDVDNDGNDDGIRKAARETRRGGGGVAVLHLT